MFAPRFFGGAGPYADLTSVIATVAPTKESPLQLDWSRPVEPDNFHQFTGPLKAPRCRQDKGAPKTQAPQGYQTVGAAARQRQLEGDFNDC